jgi:hypothetical protein
MALMPPHLLNGHSSIVHMPGRTTRTDGDTCPSPDCSSRRPMLRCRRSLLPLLLPLSSPLLLLLLLLSQASPAVGHCGSCRSVMLRICRYLSGALTGS